MSLLFLSVFMIYRTDADFAYKTQNFTMSRKRPRQVKTSNKSYKLSTQYIKPVAFLMSQNSQDK